MSYFAKPNFIVYDEWFDDNLEKTKLDVKNRKLKTISNLHDFFYKQSIYKVGASENNMQSEIEVNKKELISSNYLENTYEKYSSLKNKKIPLFGNLTKRKIKFNIKKNLLYPLSFFGFILVFGFLIFLISQSKKNDSRITIKEFNLEKKF